MVHDFCLQVTCVVDYQVRVLFRVVVDYFGTQPSFSSFSLGEPHLTTYFVCSTVYIRARPAKPLPEWHFLPFYVAITRLFRNAHCHYHIHLVRERRFQYELSVEKLVLFEFSRLSRGDCVEKTQAWNFPCTFSFARPVLYGSALPIFKS